MSSPSQNDATNTTGPAVAATSASSPSKTSSWMDWWGKFQDDQRMERLQKCREFESVLEGCRQRHQRKTTTKKKKNTEESSSSSNYHRETIEEFSAGLRTMKYFGWRGIFRNNSEQTEKEQEEGALDPRLALKIEESCAREQHAVWACRGISLGCGQELSYLKNCFEQEGPHPVLINPNTNYEPPSSSNQNGRNNYKVPCHEMQQKLGNCVAVGAQELYQRREQRRSEEN